MPVSLDEIFTALLAAREAVSKIRTGSRFHADALGQLNKALDLLHPLLGPETLDPRPRLDFGEQ